MPFTIYTASIPVFTHGLKALAACLKKGEAYATDRKFEPANLIEARLAPDMHKFSRQIQIACDIAKNAGARLAGVDAPSHPDTETTVEELHARLEKTIAFLATITEAQLQGAENREIVLKFPGREMRFDGATYLSMFALPNFYFHTTMTYAILRHNGVPLGKMDFRGP